MKNCFKDWSQSYVNSMATDLILHVGQAGTQENHQLMTIILFWQTQTNEII